MTEARGAGGAHDDPRERGQEECGDVAAGPPRHLAAEEHPLEMLADEDAREAKAIGRQLSLARDLAEQDEAQEQIGDRERDEGHGRRSPRPRDADRPALSHKIVNKKSVATMTMVFCLLKSAQKNNPIAQTYSRVDVPPPRRQPA